MIVVFSFIKQCLAKFCKLIIFFLLSSLLSSLTNGIVQLDTDFSDSDSEAVKGKGAADPVKRDEVDVNAQSGKDCNQEVSPQSGKDCNQKVSPQSNVKDCNLYPLSDKVSDWDQISPKTIPSKNLDSDQISPLTLPKSVSYTGENEMAGTYKLDYHALSNTPISSRGSSTSVFARLQGFYVKSVEVEHEDKKKEYIDQGLHKMDYSNMNDEQKNTSDSYHSKSDKLVQSHVTLNKLTTAALKENSSASSSITQDTSNLTKRRAEEAVSEAPSKKRILSDSSSDYPRPKKDNRSDDGNDSDKAHYSGDEL